MVAGEQQMVPVVNTATELRIHVRAATPAGVTAGFIKPHAPALASKPDRGGEASEPGADHMHRTRRRYHTRPCRKANHSLSDFETFTRAAGSRHPDRNKAESVAR